MGQYQMMTYYPASRKLFAAAKISSIGMPGAGMNRISLERVVNF
jgi:hypothetical protein